jgi:hypothetical protein
MANVQTISAHISRLSAKQGVDPIAVVGLLAIHALADVDFAKLRFWRNVSESMALAA